MSSSASGGIRNKRLCFTIRMTDNAAHPNTCGGSGSMPEVSSISRRKFAQLMSVSAAALAACPTISLSRSPVDEARSVAPGPVRLNSNENPYGPSPMALKAMSDAFGLSWRYPDEHADELIETLAQVNGVNRDQVVIGDGSGEILKVCASAFTGSLTSSSGPVELSKPTRGPALTFV